ncbi:response regulator [Colwellia sp. BRX10-3]|uniref:hemerythrin domain-containing protein n=1 Tax=Colwellia sp. BRX10-3 TaxID=2759844 RepID=UPI0015F50411|nr:hemerythrin domain-containing protein [Colwellia sp. BRX10-3]MBA6390885.1 response regulator [Colwellia sp. BRX10-3]
MKPVKSTNHPDIVMIYQDRDSVEPAIQQIMELGLDFKAYKYNPRKLNSLTAMKPKVLLLSSNNIKSTIEFYINYLEEYKQNIAPHSAILLINNRETFRAYLACENGLFDDYAIINPLNEPYRLKLALLQELKLIENRNNESLEQLINDGEDELASCIEHGVALKKSFITKVNQCEKDILSATNIALDNDDAKIVLQNIIGLSIDEMNESVSGSIQNILDQLLELKASNQVLKENFAKINLPQDKTIVGVNTELLISEHESFEHPQTACYKVLIAEPSDMFTLVIDKIFSGTVFKYVLVNDGQTALEKIHDFQPDVVLLAYDLPTINGIEITKIIRQEGNQVPVIAYTQYRDREAIKRWFPLGLSGYLIKPSKKSAILKSIHKAISAPTEVLEYHEKEVTNIIKWLPNYAVGNKEIDEQHQVIFTMLNDFYHKDNKQSAIMLFQHLSSYIDLQFESEEALLRQINYPDTAEHIKEHLELKEKLVMFLNKLDDYDLDLQHKIAMFIHAWLTQHILKSDMAIKTYALSIEEESFME